MTYAGKDNPSPQERGSNAVFQYNISVCFFAYSAFSIFCGAQTNEKLCAAFGQPGLLFFWRAGLYAFVGVFFTFGLYPRFAYRKVERHRQGKGGTDFFYHYKS